MNVAVVRAVLCLGIAYFIIGIAFGALAGRAASGQRLIAWRWAAWALSAAIFGGHIVYERVRARSSHGTPRLGSSAQSWCSS